MKVDGGCHCGNIKFEADVDREKVVICHCTDCQVLSGTAFRTVVPVSDENFKFTKGEPKTYVKIAESGNERAQVFCPDCGSPFYATNTGDGPKVLGVRTGTINQRDQLKPQKQVWRRSAHTWLGEVEDMPALEKQS